MNKRKNLPADKQALLDSENYEIYNRDLMRKVFPRIISEFKAKNPRAKVGDIIAFYFTILTYMDGVMFLADGKTPNRSYGAAFPTQDRITEITGINRKRQTWLAEVLRQNGIIRDIRRDYVNGRHYIYYYPSFCPIISEDGYIINAETGEKYTQDVDGLLAELDRINRR